MTTAMTKDDSVAAGAGPKDVHSVAEGAEAEAAAAVKATAAGEGIATAIDQDGYVVMKCYVAQSVFEQWPGNASALFTEGSVYGRFASCSSYDFDV